MSDLRRSFFLIPCFVIAACGGVAKVGPNSYVTEVHEADRYGVGQNAFDETNEFCAKQGKAALVTSIRTPAKGTDGDTVIKFRCLEKDDPTFQWINSAVRPRDSRIWPGD